MGHAMSSRNKTPWMVYNGKEMADPHTCINQLNYVRGVESNSWLTDEPKARTGFGGMSTNMEKELYWLVWNVLQDDAPTLKSFLHHCPFEREIHRVTGPLCGESTVHRRIPLTKGQFWCLLCCYPEWAVKETVELTMICYVMTVMWCHCNNALHAYDGIQNSAYNFFDENSVYTRFPVQQRIRNSKYMEPKFNHHCARRIPNTYIVLCLVNCIFCDVWVQNFVSTPLKFHTKLWPQTTQNVHFTDFYFVCVIYDNFKLWRYKP